MRTVLLALGHQAKNIRHRSLFFIRNVLTAFEDGKLKGELHENMITALDAADKHIALINAKRTERAKTRKGKKKAPKLIQSVRENPWAILNTTLLDNIVREEPDISPSHPYKAVPSALAQGVIQQVYSDVQGYLRSLKEYNAAPERFTGRPALPDYMGKDAVSSFEIPLSRTTGKALPPISKKDVACDVACKEYLTDEQKAVWDKYQLDKEIEALAKHLPSASRPKSLRVTFNNGMPRLVVVFDIDVEIEDKSIMAEVYKKAFKKAGKRKTKFGGTVQKRPTEEMLVEALQSIKQTDKVAGLDFGMTNLYALVFGDGTRGNILAAERLVKKLEYQHGKLDGWKSANMPARLRELQGKKVKEKLSNAEFREMKSLYREFYSHPEYIALTAKLARWSDDAFKKVAAGVIKQLRKHKIEALIVGLNKGWKNESNMGSRLNRAFHGLAHTRLFGMMRSAGEKAGILVVSTEESYTSKISFCNDTKLRNYEEEHVKQKEGCTEKEAPERTKLPRRGTRKKENGGQRGRKARHVYRNEGIGEGRPENWRKYVHADINGAFNILRKMFGWFTFNENLTLDYDLYWLSPKLGVAPMKFL